jgi:uncharacterized repeat protein (TIGR03803 family)
MGLAQNVVSWSRRGWSLAAIAVGSLLIGAVPAQAAVLNTLVAFNNSNGAKPRAGLITDASGNLYGTTEEGGVGLGGTAFKLHASNNYALSTLASFDFNNGALPQEPLTADAAGNLYGSTTAGGPGENGTVFKLDAANNYALSTLQDFNGPGLVPGALGLHVDSAGDIYGVTAAGGANNEGTVFKLTASNNFAATTIHAFNFADGSRPRGRLHADAAGNLYGTTVAGGAIGYGTTFKLDASNNFALTTLASFGGLNGAYLEGGVIADSAGNFYGTASAGGIQDGTDLGGGTVYMLDAGNNYEPVKLAYFEDGTTGLYPIGPLIADAAGNLYGTMNLHGPGLFGTVFKLDASNNYAPSLLAAFDNTNGAYPYGGLVADATGNLYGTTYEGGANGYGTVFQLTDTGFVVPEPTGIWLVIAPSLFMLRRRGRACCFGR